MATEGEVTLRLNLAAGSGGGGGGGGAGSAGSAAGSGRGAGGGGDAPYAGLREALEGGLGRALERFARAQAAAAGAAVGGPALGLIAGAAAGGVAGMAAAAALERIGVLVEELVRTMFPQMLAAVEAFGFADERAAAERVAAVTTQLARLGVPVTGEMRESLFAQAQPAEEAAMREAHATRALVGRHGIANAARQLGLGGGGGGNGYGLDWFAEDWTRLVNLSTPGAIHYAATGKMWRE